MGRPRKYAPGKRPLVTFRVQEALHERLKSEAALFGRSISEEVERRLEKALVDEATVHRLNDENAKLEHEIEVLKAALLRSQRGYTTKPQPERPTAESLLIKGRPDDPPPETIAAPSWYPTEPPPAAPTPEIEEVVERAVVSALRKTLAPRLLAGGELDPTPEDEPEA